MQIVSTQNKGTTLHTSTHLKNLIMAYDDRSIEWIESDNGIHKPFLISDPDSDIQQQIALDHGIQCHYATQEYKRSGIGFKVLLDEYFSDQCKETITRNITLMLQIDSTLRPSAMYLLEEFSRNFQITHVQPHHNVQIHQDFHETPQSQQSPGISDAFDYHYKVMT